MKIEDLIQYENDEALENHLIQVMQLIRQNNNFSTLESPDVSKILVFLDEIHIKNCKTDADVVKAYMKLTDAGDEYRDTAGVD